MQSRAVWFWAGSGVPTAALVTPQTPAALQVCVWQVVSVPQLAAVMQPTQAPCALHIRLVPQVVPVDQVGFEATPAVQTSSVQALPSTGLSAVVVHDHAAAAAVALAALAVTRGLRG